jgi:hypothetical protein
MGASKFWMLRGMAVAAAVCATCCPAGAQPAKEQALNAAIADGVSGAAVLATGVISLNPLAPLLSIGMKAATLQYTENLPDHERPAAYASATAMWAGTTANNVCLTAAVLTSGGALLPVCVAVGVAWGMKTWNDSEDERKFWAACSSLRDFAQWPNFECVYPMRAGRPAPAVRRAVAGPGELMAP